MPRYDIERIAAASREPIPEPYKPPPVPQKSWAGLHPRQRLEAPDGVTYTVGPCDSQGCYLLDAQNKPTRFETRDWKATHKRVRRTRKEPL